MAAALPGGVRDIVCCRLSAERAFYKVITCTATAGAFVKKFVVAFGGASFMKTWFVRLPGGGILLCRQKDAKTV